MKIGVYVYVVFTRKHIRFDSRSEAPRQKHFIPGPQVLGYLSSTRRIFFLFEYVSLMEADSINKILDLVDQFFGRFLS